MAPQRRIGRLVVSCSMLVTGWALSGGPAAAFAQGGTVEGMVATGAAAPPPIRVTFDQRVCGDEQPDQAILVGAAGGLANAVVTLTGVKAPKPAREAAVANETCAFVPRVQVVAPGATLRTSSQDRVLHTTVIQQADGRQLFNLALPVPGIELTRPLGGAGLLRVGCSTHQWMRGWIVVTDEMSAVTGGDGRFSLTGVPPGTYELRVWHEALKAPSQKVTITAGRTTELRVDMR